jgi:hypothetical protein
VFVAPVGFVLSLIAIFKTGPRRDRGRGLAATGLVVSVLVMGVLTSAGVWLVNSRLLDPGCLAGKEAVLKTPETADPAAFQSVIAGLKAAEGKAEHDDVRAAVRSLIDDYTQLVTAMKTGDLPPTLEQKMNADAARFDSLCTFRG